VLEDDAELRMELAPDRDLPVARRFCRSLPDQAAAVDEERVVYRARNLLFRSELAGEELLVKHFRPRGCWQRFLYCWRSSKAQRAFRNARRLQALDLPTPTPIAWVERRRGLRLLEAFFVCEWLPGCEQIRRCHDPAFPRRLKHLAAVGELAARMHSLDVHHRDLTAGNVLIQPVDDAWRYPLVDCNRMAFHPVPPAIGVRNLAQLGCDGEARDVLLKSYCEHRGIDMQWAKHRYDRALRRHRRWHAFKKATRRWRRR